MSGRIQQRRRKGWRMPEGARSEAGTSKFANPYRPARSGLSRAEVARQCREHLDAHPELVEAARRELPGLDLACYCPVDDEPCHADVLLEIADEEVDDE